MEPIPRKGREKLSSAKNLCFDDGLIIYIFYVPGTGPAAVVVCFSYAKIRIVF